MSILLALWTKRSRIASARVPSAIKSCQLSGGSWLVLSVLQSTLWSILNAHFWLVPKQELGNQINRSISGPALAKELPGKFYLLGEK
jgi:hypothetical protein